MFYSHVWLSKQSKGSMTLCDCDYDYGFVTGKLAQRGFVVTDIFCKANWQNTGGGTNFRDFQIQISKKTFPGERMNKEQKISIDW